MTYLWIRTIVLHERVLDLDSLFGIACRNRSIDIRQLVDRHVRVQLVRLLELCQMLKMINARGFGLDWPRNGRDFLDLMSLAENGWYHGGQTSLARGTAQNRDQGQSERREGREVIIRVVAVPAFALKPGVESERRTIYVVVVVVFVDSCRSTRRFD